MTEVKIPVYDDSAEDYYELKIKCLECDNLISQYEVDTKDGLCLYCW